MRHRKKGKGIGSGGLSSVRDASVEQEDAPEFKDGLWIIEGTVITWDDFLRLGTFEVGAPVGHDAVATLGRVALASVTDNGVVGNEDGQLIEGLVERVSWRKPGDAGESAALDEISWNVDEGARNGGGNSEHFDEQAGE